MTTDNSVVFSLLLSLFYTVSQSPCPYCILTVSLLYPYCIPTVSSLYPHCIPTVSLLYPHCIPTVSHCIPTVSPLYPHCIPTVSSLYPTVSPLYPHYPHYTQIYPVLHCDQTIRNPPMGVLAIKSIQRKTTFVTIYLRNRGMKSNNIHA